MRLTHPLALALTLLGLLPAAVAWSAPRIPVVVPPAAVRAGGEYVTALPELPAGVEEVELLLLPDDGSGRAIRLTPEREADGGPLRWRMPRVAAARARLVLRAGGRFGETESGPSEPFPIEPAGPRDRAEVLRGEDEIAWHFGEETDAPVTQLLPPGTPALSDAVRAAVAVKPTNGAAVRPPAPAGGTGGAQPQTRLDCPPAPPASRRPAFVPLRN